MRIAGPGLKIVLVPGGATEGDAAGQGSMAPMPVRAALWRCFPSTGEKAAIAGCAQTNARRLPSNGKQRCMSRRTANSNDLPFGWRSVELSPSPIGRGRRETWRPPQPADETCTGDAAEPTASGPTTQYRRAILFPPHATTRPCVVVIIMLSAILSADRSVFVLAACPSPRQAVKRDRARRAARRSGKNTYMVAIRKLHRLPSYIYG